jgi:hypothetical protein
VSECPANDPPSQGGTGEANEHRIFPALLIILLQASFSVRTPIMTTLILPDDLAERLHALARRENRPVEEVLSTLLDIYTASDPLTAMDGMFDDEITDLSTSVRETMNRYYQTAPTD